MEALERLGGCSTGLGHWRGRNHAPPTTFALLWLLAVLAMTGCLPTPSSHGPLPEPYAERFAHDSTSPAPGSESARVGAVALGFDPGLPARLDAIIGQALSDGVASGAAVAVGRHGQILYLRGYGRTDHSPHAPAVDAHTLFDLASLTKVVGTTTAAMILEEEGLLDLQRTVASYLPEFDSSEKAAITVRMILEHRGGLEAFARLFEHSRGRAEYLRQINARPLRRPPGTGTEYSDWDLILLQLVIERITGMTLDDFLHQRVFVPLRMNSTMFNPPHSLRSRIAATEVDVPLRGGLIHGEVHDPNAWALGGVAGHAGLFSTAHDLAIFARMLLNGGEVDGVRLLAPSTIVRWTAPQSPGSSRALGWDTPSGESSSGRYFGPRSFGHTGFTGTSLWVDPERGLFVILLTNRVNPTSANQRHALLRRAVADAVQTAVLDAPLIDWEARR